MNDFDSYFAHLTKRTSLGLMYRQAWLYPRLCRELQGQVLDIGCGIGDFLAFRPKTIGVDVNPRLVAYCREHGLDARQMPVDRLPFEDRRFDGVVLDNVLEHISEPGPLLAEVRRVLRPEGTLLVGVPGRRGYDSDPDHKVFYDGARLRKTLEMGGLRWGGLFYMPLNLIILDSYLRQYCLYATARK